MFFIFILYDEMLFHLVKCVANVCIKSESNVHDSIMHVNNEVLKTLLSQVF